MPPTDTPTPGEQPPVPDAPAPPLPIHLGGGVPPAVPALTTVTETAPAEAVAVAATVAEALPGVPAARKSPPASILAVDVGGTKVKILATGQTEPRKANSGKGFTPARLVETVRALADDW